LLLEMSLIPIVFIMYSSSTKESLSANVYLVSYSVVLGIFFLFDLMLGSRLDLNYFFLGGLGLDALLSSLSFLFIVFTIGFLRLM